jgi:type VI secretion system secreted protein Hcp
MTPDAYLQIEGIKGESQDDEHMDWVEVRGVRWCVQQPGSATASTAGGHTGEGVEMSDVSFSKQLDLASPLLLQHCLAGTTIPNARFEFYCADGNGSRIKYLELVLTNVVIGMVKSHVGPDDAMDNVSLKYSRIDCAYTQVELGVGAGGSTTGGWDFVANQIA